MTSRFAHLTRRPLLLGACALLPAALCAAPHTAAWLADVSVTSRVPFATDSYPVYIELADLALTAAEAPHITVHIAADRQPLAHQLVDTTGDGQFDRVLLVLPLAAGQTVDLQFEHRPADAPAPTFAPRAAAEISHKVGGAWDGQRYVGGDFVNVSQLTPPPQYTDHSYYIRYEGPGWESDRIGYRFYLDWRNGFDIFGKRTRDLVLHTVGQDGYDSYHQPAAWGMDILKVARAVGLGGFGAWRNNAIHGLVDVATRTATVTANGPLLAAHRIDYAGWQVGNRRHDLTAQLTIVAGSHLTRVDLSATPSLTLATGIVRLPQGQVINNPTVAEKDYTWLATWGDQSIVGDALGMAIFYRPRDHQRLATDEHNHVVVLRPRNGRVSYHFGAVWQQERASNWDRPAFETWLAQTAQLLNRPPHLDIHNRQDRDLKPRVLTAATAREWTQRVADTILAQRGDSLSFGKFDPESDAPARWRYTTALLSHAFRKLSDFTGDRRYRAYYAATISSFVADDGSIHTYQPDEYNIDHLNGGRELLALYRDTGDPKYFTAATALWHQLMNHPRTADGSFWHKNIYPEQVWLDGLYMGAPFYALYASATGHTEAHPDIARQFVLINRLARHPQTGWLHHAYDAARSQAWADPTTGLSPHVWARAVGWYAMALVDVLHHLPPKSPEAAELRTILGQVAQQIQALQDPVTGLWFQVMDQPERIGNYPETSASTMFVYALATAINRKDLEASRYTAVALRGFEGLLRHAVHVDAAGNTTLGGICEVAGLSAGRDGSFDYYLSEPVVKHDAKGTGPFLLAGIAVSKLLSNQVVP
jgi:unsaturated rhamnogalacturonyl hydrolase